jgi:hypothetical protein
MAKKQDYTELSQVDHRDAHFILQCLNKLNICIVDSQHKIWGLFKNMPYLQIRQMDIQLALSFHPIYWLCIHNLAIGLLSPLQTSLFNSPWDVLLPDNKSWF